MCLLIIAKNLVCDLWHEGIYLYCITEIQVHLHQAIWFRCVCLIGAIESIIPVIVVRIVQVLLEAQLDVASMSQTSQVMEEIEVVFMEVIGAFQKLDHRKMKPRCRVISVGVVSVMIPPCSPRHASRRSTACSPAMFNDGVV